MPAIEIALSRLEHEPAVRPVQSFGIRQPKPIPSQTLARLVEDGDATTSSLAFMRGPQVLATDAAIDANDGAVPSDWWGSDLYTCKCEQDGNDKEFRLTSFADAGQDMEEYTALHEGIETTRAIKK